MDKVKEVLKYRFWILFGLAVLFSALGYFMTVGEVQAAFDTKKTEITSTRDSVKGGAGTPNSDYEEKLSEFVSILDGKNVEVKRELFIRQLGDMTWPGDVARFMDLGYRAPLEKNAYRNRYADLYADQIEDLWLTLEPVLTPEQRVAKGKRPEKIYVPLATVPKDDGIKPFMRQPITSERMWDAQEDIWYLRSLFESLARCNESSETISDSVIRQISKIELYGGDGTPVPEGGLAVASSAAAPVAAGGYDGGYGGGYDGGFADAGGAAGGGSKAVKIAFNPDEEFGDRGGAAAQFSGVIDYEGGGATESTANKPHRYIGHTKGAPYRERGFYLSMLVEQDAINDIIASLSNSRWPTRVVRYSYGRNPNYDGSVKKPTPKPAVASFNNPLGGGGGDTYSPDYGADYGGDTYSPDYGGGGGSGIPDGYDPYGGGGGGGAAAGPADYSIQSGPTATDKSVLGALSGPNLVQLELAGAITMYEPPPEDVLPVARQRVPVIGQEYKILPPTVTDESVGKALTEADANAEAAAREQENAAEEAAVEAAKASGELNEDGTAPVPEGQEAADGQPPGEGQPPATGPAAAEGQPASPADVFGGPAASDAPATGNTPSGDAPAAEAGSSPADVFGGTN